MYLHYVFIDLPFYFSEDPQENNGKISENLYSQTALTWLISWALEIPMLLIYTPFLVWFFSYISTFPSLIFKLQIFRLCSFLSFFNNLFQFSLFLLHIILFPYSLVFSVFLWSVIVSFRSCWDEELSVERITVSILHIFPEHIARWEVWHISQV